MVDALLFASNWRDYGQNLGAVLLKKDLSNLPKIGDRVILVQDVFVRYFDSAVLRDFVNLLVKLNIVPCILPLFENGKPL